MNTELVLIIIIVVLLGIMFVLLLTQRSKQEAMMKQMLLESERVSNKELQDLKNNMTNELLQFQLNMTQTIKTDLNHLNETTINKMNFMETKVQDSLLKTTDTTNKALINVLEQMAKIDEAQNNLKNLSASISNLQGVLTDKKTRGTFGEVELYSILESVFGVNESRFKKQYKFSNGAIADAVLFAPEPLGKIVVDSKFPLENYNKIYDTLLSVEQQTKARSDFKKDVLKHIKDISSKYVINGETADFAYMFIPAEAVFAEIYGKFDDLIQQSYLHRVYLVSPTTLMAYITAIKAIYLGQEKNAKVELIQVEFLKLGKEFERFETRFESVNKDFEKTYQDMAKMSTTTKKIITRFKQIDAVELVDQTNLKLEHHVNDTE